MALCACVTMGTGRLCRPVTFALLACLASWASFSGGQLILAFITFAVLPSVSSMLAFIWSMRGNRAL